VPPMLPELGHQKRLNDLNESTIDGNRSHSNRVEYIKTQPKVPPARQNPRPTAV
jgi:hypothetical protein